MAQVAIRAKVAPVSVVVHPSICAASVSVDLLWRHVGKAGSPPFDFRKPLRSVFPSQPSPCHARETQHAASSLLGIRREVSRLVVVFRL